MASADDITRALNAAEEDCNKLKSGWLGKLIPRNAEKTNRLQQHMDAWRNAGYTLVTALLLFDKRNPDLARAAGHFIERLRSVDWAAVAESEDTPPASTYPLKCFLPTEPPAGYGLFLQEREALGALAKKVVSAKRELEALHKDCKFAEERYHERFRQLKAAEAELSTKEADARKRDSAREVEYDKRRAEVARALQQQEQELKTRLLYARQALDQETHNLFKVPAAEQIQSLRARQDRQIRELTARMRARVYFNFSAEFQPEVTVALQPFEEFNIRKVDLKKLPRTPMPDLGLLVSFVEVSADRFQDVLAAANLYYQLADNYKVGPSPNSLIVLVFLYHSAQWPLEEKYEGIPSVCCGRSQLIVTRTLDAPRVLDDMFTGSSALQKVRDAIDRVLQHAST